MTELMEVENLKIEDMIYEIRGKQVMLDSDVAKLYHSETRVINQVVKRNIEHFPQDFCFQLTKEEYLNLRLQIITSSDNKSLRTPIVMLNKFDSTSEMKKLWNILAAFCDELIIIKNIKYRKEINLW